MTARENPSPIVVAILPCPPAPQLEAMWRTLEMRAAPPLFLSWAWIGAQVAAFGTPAYLVQANRGAEIVGLALLGHRPGIWAPSLHLNETGDGQHDSAMIEYNGLLTSESGDGPPAALIMALIAALTATGAPRWRDLHLSGVPASWTDACRAQGLAVRLLRAPQPAPFMDFADLTTADPLDALSGNSRQQIRRSLRWFARHGPLAVDRAADAAEAVEWLDALAELHAARWQAKNKPGAFANPCFAAFHRTLIGQAFDAGVPELLRIRAGPEVIGYLYNFIWRGWAYAYQSGLCYGEDPDCRPGLVAHLLAIRRCRDLGLRGYRFLAGDARYKFSFATGKDPLVWMAVHRFGWGDRVAENIRRAWKRDTDISRP